MRLVTSERMRSVGLLLIEAAGLGLLVSTLLSADPEVVTKAKALALKVRNL